MIEAVGYLGSALVVTSLLMTRILRLRMISLMGATTFLVYGLLIESIPIVLTNVVIIGINVVFLWRATRVDEWFSLLEVRPESRYLAEFSRFHGDDIAIYQPEWDGLIGDSDTAILVLRDMQPAMAIVGTMVGNDVMELRLDYAIPKFRDYRMGRFVYQSNSEFFRNRSIRSLVTTASTKPHIRYLEKMGFSSAGESRYELALV